MNNGSVKKTRRLRLHRKNLGDAALKGSHESSISFLELVDRPCPFELMNNIPSSLEGKKYLRIKVVQNSFTRVPRGRKKLDDFF